MKLIRISIILAVIVAVLLPATPVFADQADPDSNPSIESFNVYRNLLETGDMLVIIYANIPYASLPSDPVDQAFIWRMIDIDNTTELGSTVGYAFNDDGYGYNIYSMYWSAASVTSLSIVWGTSYTIRLSGNPAIFDDPPEYNYALGGSDYTTSSNSTDVKTEMGQRIITIATDLNIKWALAVDYYLTLELETATALSITGAEFFRNAIYGIQGMVPQVFRVVLEDIEVTAREWDTGYSENLTNQWDGTWVETAKAAGTTLFGTSYDLTSLMLLTVLAIGILVVGVVLTGNTWVGAIDASVILILGTKLGMLGLGFLGLIVAMSWLYVAIKLKRVFS